MKKLSLLSIFICICFIRSWAQLNDYVVGVEINPIVNSLQSPLGFSVLSLNSKIPFKIVLSGGDATPQPDNHYSAYDKYSFQFAYLKPGLLLKLLENPEKKSLLCVSINLNFNYINHDFSTMITDDLGTSRTINYSKNAYAWGYQVELIKYQNIRKSVFSIHYGAGLGISHGKTDVLTQYINTRNGYFNRHSPGIGRGFTVFLGIGSRIFKP
jgi:hypothetical protein